jgi:hypothetical protein
LAFAISKKVIIADLNNILNVGLWPTPARRNAEIQA